MNSFVAVEYDGFLSPALLFPVTPVLNEEFNENLVLVLVQDI